MYVRAPVIFSPVSYHIVLYCMAGLSLDESSLTGEQQPREKSGKALPGKQYHVMSIISYLVIRSFLPSFPLLPTDS